MDGWMDGWMDREPICLNEMNWCDGIFPPIRATKAKSGGRPREREDELS